MTERVAASIAQSSDWIIITMISAFAFIGAILGLAAIGANNRRMEDIRRRYCTMKNGEQGQLRLERAKMEAELAAISQAVAQQKSIAPCGHPAEEAVAHANETAWLAERLDKPNGPEYATVSDIGMVEFTADPNKAIRFKRMEDARQMAGLFEFEDVRAKEHSWPSLKSGERGET